MYVRLAYHLLTSSFLPPSLFAVLAVLALIGVGVFFAYRYLSTWAKVRDGFLIGDDHNLYLPLILSALRSKSLASELSTAQRSDRRSRTTGLPVLPPIPPSARGSSRVRRRRSTRAHKYFCA